MATANEKAILEAIEFEADDINLDNLEQSLEDMLQGKKEDLDFLKEEREHINNPDHLGETIMDVVCEQFMNQVVATVGEDFIKENGGLTLDLRSEAHIQTSENFADGKIATHNYISKDQLEQNYDRYKNTPHKEFRDKYVDPGMNATLKRAGELKKKGIDTVTDIYTGRQIPTEKKSENGKDNPKAAQREHVKPSAELYKDPSLQMANNNEELAAIINNPENLQGYTTAERNNRKSNNSPEEMSKKDKNKHWEKANERAEEYIGTEKKRGENRLKEEGHKTQKEEFFKIEKAAVKTAFISMLSALVKEIISKLVLWLKSAEKSLKTLIEHVKMALKAFISKLKDLFVDAAGNTLTMIATAIIGPVVGIIKKTITLLKQGWKSLKEAIDYLRQHRGEPLSRLMPEVGIIVVTGLCGIGTIVLGEAIEKGLESAVPFLAVEIPFLGIKPTSLIGSLMGAIVCGVVGAIAINIINKHVAKQQKSDNLGAQIDKDNEILVIQDKLLDVKEQRLLNTCQEVAQELTEHHREADEQLKGILENVTDPAISEAQRMNSEALSQLLQSS